MNKIVLLCFLVFTIACNQKNDLQGSTNNVEGASQEETLKKEFAIFPDSALVLQNLVTYYVSMQNYDAALNTVNTVLSKDSGIATLWDLKSMIAVQKGDTAMAIQALENAIAITALPEYVISLGELYAEAANPRALEMADALLLSTRANSQKEALFIKGLYYTYKNEKQTAILLFEKCIALDYNFIQAYIEKGLALYDLAKYNEAAKILETAIKVKNTYGLSYYYLGKCYEKLNRPKEAIEVYDIVLQLNPDDEDAKDALSRLGVK